jgi:hypothetical protein
MDKNYWLFILLARERLVWLTCSPFAHPVPYLLQRDAFAGVEFVSGLIQPVFRGWFRVSAFGFRFLGNFVSIRGQN